MKIIRLQFNFNTILYHNSQLTKILKENKQTNLKLEGHITSIISLIKGKCLPKSKSKGLLLLLYNLNKQLITFPSLITNILIIELFLRVKILLKGILINKLILIKIILMGGSNKLLKI